MSAGLPRLLAGWRSLASGGGGGGGGSVPSSRQVIAGSGLSGGGALSSDVTLQLAARYLADNQQQNISAAGADQAAATAIAATSHKVYVNGGTANQGVRLPLTPTVGDTYYITPASSVLNNPNSGSGILVYPGVGDNFRNRGANVALVLYAFQTLVCRCITAGATAVWEATLLPGYYDASAELALTSTFNHYGIYVNTSSVQIYGNLQFFNGAPLAFSGSSGNNRITMLDNLADALSVMEAANIYMTFVSTDGSERIRIRKNMVLEAQVGQNIPATLTTAGTTITVDWNNGNAQVIDLQGASGNVTLTLSNPLAGASYVIKVIQGSVTRNLIWPATVKWPGGIAPTISAANDAMDLITLFWDGTNYLATFQQAFA